MDHGSPTSCIICSINCGLRVRTEGRRITAVRGDRDHPTSQGYLCEKSRALDHYQNGRDRLNTPLRRRADGTYEPVGWYTAIAEIAARLAAVRDAHGGDKIFYYGGGGQANHLGGAYGRALRAGLGSVYTSNALAQEKTGEFWVDGQLYGRARCHTTPDFEHAEVAVFVGKNPWQSHGFPRARAILKQIAKDPARSLIVIDPRRTRTAEMADIHLQVRPGADAWLLAAMVKLLIEEGGLERAWLAAHATRLDQLVGLFSGVSVPAYCRRAGVDEALVRRAVARMAAAESVSVLEDLGVQQAPHSTLSSWLEKLLYLLTGNFGKRGGMNIHTSFASLGSGRGTRPPSTTPIGGHRIIGGLMPCNAIAEACLSDHPDRFRAMIVESANPAHSLADTPMFVAAMRALEFSVVIDVAFTETAALADYVLPAASQFEKWEASFFTLEFPNNAVQLRKPLFEPLEGTLAEAEIHTRLLRALGALDDFDLSGLHAAARQGLDAYAMAFAMAVAKDRRMLALAPAVLYETIGPALPAGAHQTGSQTGGPTGRQPGRQPGRQNGRQTAVIWGLCQSVAMTYPASVKRAGFTGPLAGNQLFRALLERPSGVFFSIDDYDATLARLETPDKKVNLVIDDLVEELRSLEASADAPSIDPAFPFVLAAGERRSNTANTLFRDPAWRKQPGTLRMNPQDAARLGLGDGTLAAIITKRGRAVAPVETTDSLQSGHASLPNGHGLSYPDAAGERRQSGVSTNELTSVADRDPIAGTPWHKHVRARIEPAG